MIEAPGNYSSAGEQAHQALNPFVTRWDMVDAKTRRPLISYLSSFAIVLVDMPLLDFVGAIFPIFEAECPHLDRSRRNLKNTLQGWY
jgi:hypothetical protein